MKFLRHLAVFVGCLFAFYGAALLTGLMLEPFVAGTVLGWMCLMAGVLGFEAGRLYLRSLVGLPDDPSDWWRALRWMKREERAGHVLNGVGPSVLETPVLARLAHYGALIVSLLPIAYGMFLVSLPDRAAAARALIGFDGIGWPWRHVMPAIRGIADHYPRADADTLALLRHLDAVCWWSVVLGMALLVLYFALDARRIVSQHRRRLAFVNALPSAPVPAASLDPRLNRAPLVLVLGLLALALPLLIFGPGGLSLPLDVEQSFVLLPFAGFAAICSSGFVILTVVLLRGREMTPR